MKTLETLWTVYDSTAQTVGSGSAGVAQATAVQQELRRLNSVAALVELPGEIVGEHLPEQIARWYQPWKQRYSVSRARLAWQQALDGPARTQSGDSAEVAKLDAAMGQVDERLGASTVETRPEQAYRSAAELLSLDRGPQKPARFLARGAAPRLELAHVPLPGVELGEPYHRLPDDRAARIGRGRSASQPSLPPTSCLGSARGLGRCLVVAADAERARPGHCLACRVDGRDRVGPAWSQGGGSLISRCADAIALTP